jgi:hypothetical protein
MITSSTTKLSDSKQLSSDKVVYLGVINLLENERLIGAVDVWRSVISKELFCEEKRLGILDIGDKIGMPKIPTDRKWAVAISNVRTGKDKWNLVSLIKSGEATFTDQLDEKIMTVKVEDYIILDKEWWSFLVEKNVNRNIDITKEGNAK